MSQRLSQFNEGRACDAVIRYLERRFGAVRANVQFPDRDRLAAPIEVAFELSSTLFAMEHTGIEPFEGHTRLQTTASIGILPVVAAVEGQLSHTEDFELHVPAGAFDRLGRRRLQDVQRSIIDWVLQTWSKLAIAPIGRYDTSVRPTSIPGVPFEVKFHRLAGPVKPGSLQVVHIVRDVESLRRAKVRAALEKKLPKLGEWQEKFGARTVLVLEQNDIQLTNVHLVTDALLKAEAEFSRIADEVYLVTSTISPWWVHFVRVDGRSYFDLTAPDDRAWEVDPASLTSITERHT